MALQHDSQGFLIGDKVDLDKMPSYLLDIKRDVLAIKNAAIKPANSQRTASAPAATNQRDLSGRLTPKSPNIATPTGSRRAEAGVRALAESIGLSEGKQKQAAERMRSASRKSGSTAINGRDASGRFVGGDGSGSGSSSNSAVSVLAAKLSRLSGIGEGLEDVDPSIRAFQEVAEPMKRGIEFFGGSGDQQTSWLKKIFKSLNFFHKEDTVYNKAAKKSLKAIEEKQSYSGEQGSSGLAIGGLLAGLGGKKALMMLLKKTPILGAILGMLGIGADVAGIEGDSSLSRRDKNKAIGSDVGGFGGTVAGMLAGGKAGAVLGSFLGPAGTAVGSVIGAGIGMLMGDQFGQIVGSTFGDWASDLIEADVPGKIVGAWNVAVEKITAIFGDIKGMASKAFDIAGEQLNDANNYVKKSTGVDVKDLGSKWIDRTKSNVSGAIDGVKAGMSWLGSNTTAGKISSRISGKRGSPEQAMQILMDRGWSKAQAAGISANLKSESDFNTTAVGDGGKAIGVAQWHPDRQQKFKDVFGKDLSSASFEEQVSFVDWELRNTERKAGDKIKSTATAKQAAAAAATEQFHERSAIGLKGGVQAERLQNATKYSQISTISSPVFKAPSMPVMPGYANTPAVIQPLGTPETPNFTVNMPAQDVGQNVSDRGIAHIISGGIGGHRLN